MSKSKKKRSNPFQYALYDFVKITAALPGWIAYRPKLLYENAKAKEKIRGGALIISNHGGFFDPAFLQFCIWYRRHHFICLKKLFEKPLSAWFFGHVLCIPVDRENMSLDTLNEIVGHLKKDEIVSMFPDGKIVFDGENSNYKSGMVLMAAMSKKPIVPIYIKHRTHVYERLIMVVGEPIDVTGGKRGLPTLAQIESTTVDIHEHQKILQEIAEKGR